LGKQLRNAMDNNKLPAYFQNQRFSLEKGDWCLTTPCRDLSSLDILEYGLQFKTAIVIVNQKLEIMENLLYIIAVILVIAWAIGFLGYHAGGLIHILLVIAVIAVILRLIRGRSPL
jgi:hypothetical protein